MALAVQRGSRVIDRTVELPPPLSDSVELRLPPAPAAKARKGWRAQGGIVIGMAIGGAIGFFGARHGLDLLLPSAHKLVKVVGVLLMPVWWLVAVGWHELGHLVGGWIGGGRFLLWVVGPFKVQRTPSGVRVGLNRSVNLLGGLAACLPQNPNDLTPRRAAVMIVAGPIASLLLCGILLWLAAIVSARPGDVTAIQTVTQHGLMFCAGLSALIFVVTVWPAVAGGYKTDGKRAYDLMKGDHRSDQEAALLVLTTAGLAGMRPADYDPVLVRRALSLRDGSLFDLYAHLTIYYHAADRGAWAQAQQHLDVVLSGEEKLVPYARDIVRCEYAWLLATQTTNAAAARAWLDAAGKLDFDPATRLRAEAAVALAEGRRDDAITKARAAQHALEHKSLSPVKSPFAAAALDEIVARATA